MNRKVLRRLTLPATAIAALASSGFVTPQTATESLYRSDAIGMRVLRPAVTSTGPEEALYDAPSRGTPAMHFDADSGAVRLITGNLLAKQAPGNVPTLASLLPLVHEYMAAHPDLLGVKTTDLELNRKAVLLDRDVQFLKFNVKRDGILIEDAAVAFRFKAGKLVQVANQSYAEATLDARPPAANLAATAKGAVFAAAVEPQGESLRVVPVAGGYQLVRIAAFKATGQDGRHFGIQVESATGQVFEIRPLELYLEGTASGSVYPRTYYEETAIKLPYRDLTLSYSGGTVTTDADGKFTDAPASAEPKLAGFVGTRINVAPQTGGSVAIDGALAGPDQWDVLFQKSQDEKAMAQSMTYYHLNKEINYAKKYVTSPWFDQQLTANVNLSESCNAFWDGSSVNLYSAGKGCANTGLIADVFYHEWGHGLHANAGGIQDYAFSEGFADTLALMMTHSPLIGHGFRVADGSPVRDLRTLKVYPQDQNEDPHKEGLILGGAFYDLYTSMKDAYGEEKAGDLLSTFALKQIFTATKYTDVYDALLVIDAPADDGTAHGPNYCRINTAFTRHGLATADAACAQ